METLQWFWDLDIGQQSRWDSIYNFYNGTENGRYLFTVCLIIAHSLTFYVTNIGYFLLDLLLRNTTERFRYQPGKHPTTQLVWDCVKHVTIFHIVVSFAPYIMYPVAIEHNPTMFTAPVPGVGKFIAQLGVAYLFTDFFFYWAHRMLHTSLFYIPVHKLHHKFHQPIGFACEYAHPLELIVGNVLPVISAPVLLKYHFYVFCSWMVIAILGTSWGHSGFRFPFAFSNGHHDFHHSHNIGNYGSLPFWDYILGTDKEWRKWLAKQQLQQQQQVKTDEKSAPVAASAETVSTPLATSKKSKVSPRKSSRSPARKRD